jgi:hypothetical protein
MGFKIFVHAIDLVFNNLGSALRISGLLYFVPAVLYQVVALMVVAPSANPLATLNIVTAVYGIVACVAALWTAVAWHRYVLLDETPGAALPVFHGDRVLAYFGNSLLLGLIALGIALVVMFPLGLVAAGFARGGGPFTYLAVVVPLISIFVIAVFMYRLALILPASAVGKPIRLSEAWAATSGTNGAIFVIALASAVCIVLISLPTAWLTWNAVWWVTALWEILVGWVQVIVGVSIITTLYGHYVEKRALP